MERDIDMGQTIEEAARIERERIILELHADYKIHGDARHYVISSTVIGKYGVNLFKAGAEWQAKQSPWVSVKERFPEDYEPKIILLKDGQIRVAHFDSGDRDFGVDYFWHDKEADESFDFKDVVAYMNIPSFDEILESNKDVLQRMKENGD